MFQRVKSVFRSFFESSGAHPRRRAQVKRSQWPRLHLERLEDRTAPASVAVFDNPAYVDTGGGSGAESDNLQASLTALGHTVSTFTDISAAGFDAALTGKDNLLIPDQELRSLNLDLSAEARTVIRNFVAGGGGLIVHADYFTGGSATLLNGVFAFSLVEGQNPGPTNRRSAASGTNFADDPATLADNNGTSFLTAASLPAGARRIYDNGTSELNGTRVPVALIPFGAGQIVYLGWDWYNSNPPNAGGQDGGWQTVLASATTPPARQATFVVDSVADTVAVNLSTGRDASGKISLRSAIMAANSDVLNPGDNTIILPAGTFTLTRAGTNENTAVTGDLDIFHGNGKVIITGAGADATIIDAAGLDRAFHVFGATVEISRVTIRGGSEALGGAISNTGTLALSNSTLTGNSAATFGGAIENFYGTLTVSQSTFEGNAAQRGGAIINDNGVLTVSRSIFSGNTASSFGAGIYNVQASLIMIDSVLVGNTATDAGGGIFNQFSTSVTISGSSFFGNSAREGAGIFNKDRTALEGCTFTGNSANLDGGAVLNDRFGTLTANECTFAGNSAFFGAGIKNSRDATAIVKRSSFSGNAAARGGGAVFNSGSFDSQGGNLTIGDCTVSGNRAVEFGGGISSDGKSVLSLKRSTITGNFADFGGGLFLNSGSSVSIANSLVAGNTANSFGPDISGLVNSSGYNLVGNSAGSLGFGATGDLLNVDPRLGPLADNGGPTLTHALMAGSPALDAGSNAGAPPLDQRGFARFRDGPDANTTATTDIGAFEAGFWVADIGNQTMNEDASVAVNFGTSLGIANVTATSSNPFLLPYGSLNVTGAGAGWTLNINPAADQSGTAVITVTASDGFSSMTDTFLLTVNPVNDAPTISDVGNQTIDEDASTAALAFTVGDLETAVSALVMSGVSSNPALVPFANIAFAGSGANRTVTVKPAADQFGTATITITVSDGGTSASDTFELTVNAVNDAPVNRVPVAQKTLVNKTLVFSAARFISIADVDAGSSIVRVTLTATNGTLTLGTTAGLASVIGIGKASITLTGTVANINAALNGLRFKPKTNFRGKAKLTIFTEDLGNAGLGGPKSASATVAITVA